MKQKSENRTKTTIKPFVSRCYSIDQSKLSLTKQPNQWKQILTYCSWSNIKQLDLHECKITDQGIFSIINLKWSSLQIINLSSNLLTSNSIKRISKVQWPSLKKIILDKNQICNEGFIQLCIGKESYPQANHITLNNTNLTSNAFKSCRMLSIFMKSIKILNISIILIQKDENKIGSKGIKLFVKNNFCLLQHLQLQRCQIGSEGAKHLSKAKWQNLKQLFIDNNSIKIDGYFSFHEHSFQKIKQIRVEKDEYIKIIGFASTKLQAKGEFKCAINNEKFKRVLKEYLGIRTFFI